MNNTLINYQNVSFTQGVTSNVYHLDDEDLDFNIKVTFNSRGQWVVSYGSRPLSPLETATFSKLLMVAAQFASDKAAGNI